MNAELLQKVLKFIYPNSTQQATLYGSDNKKPEDMYVIENGERVDVKFNEVKKYYEDNKNYIDNKEKIDKLRKIRDNLLFIYSTPLNLQKISEDRLIERGKLLEADRKITKAVLDFYDELFMKWRDLPKDFDFYSVELEDIKEGNKNIFGKFPDVSVIWDVK